MVGTEFRGLRAETGISLDRAIGAGFRFGDKGTHTSRTMMLDELTTLFDSLPPESSRDDYQRAIVDENTLRKNTAATCKLTNQRLGELYGLDPDIKLFRVLRHLWDREEVERPLLALLAAIARDPLLAATTPVIAALQENEEIPRTAMRGALRHATGDRLNDSVLDKVVRNAASSWTQSGHLEGRTFKYRRRVMPTPAVVAYGLYLAYLCGFRGDALFASGWMQMLDLEPRRARDLADDGKRFGLLDLREQSNVLDIGFDNLDPWTGKA